MFLRFLFEMFTEYNIKKGCLNSDKCGFMSVNKYRRLSPHFLHVNIDTFGTILCRMHAPASAKKF